MNRISSIELVAPFWYDAIIVWNNKNPFVAVENESHWSTKACKPDMKELENQVAKVFQQQRLSTLKKLNKTIKKFRPSLNGEGGGRERDNSK